MKYFAISQPDREWGLYILDCGIKSIKKNDKQNKGGQHPTEYRLNWNKGRILHEYQLIYVVKGAGSFENENSKTIKITSGSIIMLHPGIWHRYKPDEGIDWQTYWIGFGGMIARLLIKKTGFTADSPIRTIGYEPNVIETFTQIIKTSQVEFAGYQQVLASDLMKLFGWIHTSEKRAKFKDDEIDSIIHMSKILLMENHYEPIASIAQELNIGYSKFRKLFKAYTGMSPGEFRMQHKIRRAMDLLIGKPESVKEVAYELGFESPQYFIRIFKKKAGMTPSEYRKQSLEQIY